MSIFKKKITNTFDIARELGVEESKIKELKNGERQIGGGTMDKVLSSLNKSQTERDIEKLNIYEWYKSTDLKKLREDFGYVSGKQLALKVGVQPSELCRFENKQYNKINKTIIKMYDFFKDDFNKKIEKEESNSNENKELTEKDKILEWYKNADLKELRKGIKQKDIAKEIGMSTPSLCFLEKHNAVTYSTNMAKLYNYYNNKPNKEREIENSFVNKEVKADEGSTFDEVIETENLGAHSYTDEKDITKLYKYIEELRTNIEKQNKEIDRLTRQVHCYEKLIERL